MRYSNETKEKSNGVVYTPKIMADYLAGQMLRFYNGKIISNKPVKILDPASGEGELLIAMASLLYANFRDIKIEIVGYETDPNSAIIAKTRIENTFPNAVVDIRKTDFLEDADEIINKFDFVIANPPYIRTQILGSDKAQEVAQKMGLTGRIDIYYAFLLYTKNLLTEDGISGYITSNKFLTIKSGAAVRDFMISNYKMLEIIDFGDTKLFSASVLPCIVIFSKGQTNKDDEVLFTSIYETKTRKALGKPCESIFEHIHDSGSYEINDGRIFKFQQGRLESPSKGALWTLSSSDKADWLNKIESNTWLHFSNIGKIRVGIKTTADNVFIGDDWSGEKADLELLRPLITHRNAGQIVSNNSAYWQVLYTHYVQNGKRAVIDINDYPKSKAYLETHYEQLAGRTYIKKANRNWYEIWVPQNPASWANRKIVFRDISKQPQFWLDETGAIVNGDCYWIDINPSIIEETVYLALAVANSHFIEKYYDAKFNTKLYSGKRRYMSQYVEQFPIPFTTSQKAQEAIELVKKIITGCKETDASCYMEKINQLVEDMFLAD